MEELQRQENIPRVHPEELIGPPTYAEAVEMPRLARSLDNLDLISTEGLGQSAQSLDHEAWSRKRRKQSRKKISKRARSEDDLDTRTESRIRNSSRLTKNCQRSTSASRRVLPPKPGSGQINSSRNIERQCSGSDAPASSPDGNCNRPSSRPRTPMTKKKRRWRRNDGHSSDDEDSDVLRNSTLGTRRGTNLDSIQVVELPREPRSGTYRPPSLVSSPDPEGMSESISRSKIV